MSSNNINISSKNISGNCDLKCQYSYKYPQSNSTAKNNGVMISLTYDNSSVPPVLYNEEKYNVSQFTIVCPSIHIFEGNNVDAEIYIEHIPINGGQTLYVAVPIISSSESSNAGNLLTEIINSVSTNAPSEGDSTNLNINGLSLQYVVQNKPFYSYTDTNNSDWIVYDVLDAIPLSSNTLSKLAQIIKPFSLPTEGGELFHNPNGPITKSIGDGIYISCKPTGSSEEETPVTYTTSSSDYSDIWNNSVIQNIIQILIGCILFIGIFYIIYYAYNCIATGSTSLPPMPSFSGKPPVI
jgi:carbonic anhydrase